MARFVQVVDSKNRVQIINTKQIVRAYRKATNWDVLLTSGEPVTLLKSEARKLFGRLAGIPHAEEADPK
jgi:L-lysine 2,3-aminomutase